MSSTRQPDRYSTTGQRLPRYVAGVAVTAAIITGLAFAAMAQSDGKTSSKNEPSSAVATNQSGGDAGAPRRHFRLRNPAQLSNQQAEAVYGNIRKKMSQVYAASGVSAARDYPKWQRYNIAPFRSATHGRRFVNHYANPIAGAYGNYDNVGVLPVGSLIAKDSFAVMDDSKILPGPLFLMEKMPAGFNYVSADWRYTMVMPDGSIFGTTNGVGSEKVKFCISCHLAVEKQDHLYFPPKEFRRQ